MNDFNELEEERLYKKAKKKAQTIRGFYINLVLYVTVIPFLIFNNLTYSPEFHWFYFSMLGWGIGLFFHGMEAFGWNVFFRADWEERKIKGILEKENRKNQHNK